MICVCLYDCVVTRKITEVVLGIAGPRLQVFTVGKNYVTAATLLNRFMVATIGIHGDGRRVSVGKEMLSCVGAG